MGRKTPGRADRAAYKQILVPLDGSRFAEQVLPHVRTLAARLRTSIVLVRVEIPSGGIITPPPAAMSPGADGWLPVDLTETLRAEREQGLAYLVRVAEGLRAEGFTVLFEQVEGTPAEAILERATALGVDLIAMTTHGLGGLRRLVLGSVADAVVKAAPCPVVLVRAPEHEP